MATNRDRIAEMLRLIETGAAKKIEAQLKAAFGANWRNAARLPKSLSGAADMDAYAWLYALVHNWRDAFQDALKPELRDAASAALAGRNKWGHSSAEIDDMLTLRAISGAVDLFKGLNATTEAGKAQKLVDEIVAKLAKATGAAKVADDPAPTAAPNRPALKLTAPAAPAPVQGDLLGGGGVTGLTPWRIACPPRDDVLEGRLNKDAFAANLAAADRGEGAETYADAEAFFRATHLTHGLSLVLRSAGRRLSSGDGPSTIGLQTNFGGGKTHTLLSLLHLTRVKSLKGIDTLSSLSSELGVDGLKGVASAAFVGTDKGPDIPLDFASGKPIRTLWGYLAWRLAGAEGLAMVAPAEAAGTNPGAQIFQRVFERAGPSIVLLDELVAYIRQLSGERYEAHISFLQSLTEAAAQTRHALIVGSLPESDIEAGGGEKGRETLRTLEKLFGRTQSAWQPAQGSETYAVIRRRLFQDLDDNGEKARKRTVEAFRKLYRDHKGDFPPNTVEKDYEEKLTEAYPVHPMLFDKLSAEWGGLDKFQRTRGVLSLLARTIYASYRDRSDEPLILPSSLRMNDPEVRGALMEPLDGQTWGSIIDGEVDGDTSLPARMELSRPRYRNDQIVRRAARAVFVCTAPKGDSRGGLTGPELRLSCANPGDQVSIFGDALRELAERAGYLYESDGRYWFGGQPTLNKLADNRAADIDPDRIDAKLVELLKEDEKSGRGRWAGVHVAPNPATDVDDKAQTRLVVLGPSTPYVSGGGSPAEVAALDTVARRTGGQRKFRNALLFLAADQKLLDDARRTVRRMLAWDDIASDKRLVLVEGQREDARSRASDARKGAQQAVRKAWSHLLSPSPSAADAAVVEIERLGIRATGQSTICEAAWQKAAEGHAVLELLGRTTLLERLGHIWPTSRDDLEIDVLRDWFSEFPYMERLRDEQVLADAISAAVADISDEGLGLAAGKDASGRYQGLLIHKRVEPRFGTGMLLVRNAVARAQVAADGVAVPDPSGSARPTAAPAPSVPTGSKVAPRPTRFVGAIELDSLRGLARAGQVFESIINELDRVPGTKFRITLEVSAIAEAGFPEDVENVVRDNAATLGFVDKRFD
jgi:hypothetical protein